MRTMILLAATIALAVPSAFALGIEAPVQTTTDYIVGFVEMPEDRSQYGGEPVVFVNEAIQFLVVRTINPLALQVKAAADPNVAYIEEDAWVYGANLVPNDTFYNAYQYGTKPSTTNIELAWDTTLGSTTAKVCVADTGQYRAHQDFSGTTWYGWNDLIGGKSSAYDDNGHGTHVTGTIAARTNNGNGIAGVAQASIAGVKVLDRRGSGSISTVASGITWCTDIGSHIISASIGGPGTSTLQNAVNYADAAGVLQVYAAGNSGPCSNCVDYPAHYTVSVAVSCTTSTNALCSFSSTGPEVDFAAPGLDIPSTWPAGKTPCTKTNTNCFVLSSGTSMSTPHVSGLAALVKAAHPTYTKQQIYDAIKNTAQDLGSSGWDANFGWGLIKGNAV